MTYGHLAARTGRSLVIGAAVLAAVGLAAPRPAHALSTGAAVGLGLGAFALGSAVGASANPYYYPYNPYYPYPYYPYSYYPTAPAYYPPAAAYQPRRCWNPSYGGYYAC
jgi:hypothetical protein